MTGSGVAHMRGAHETLWIGLANHHRCVCPQVRKAVLAAVAVGNNALLGQGLGNTYGLTTADMAGDLLMVERYDVNGAPVTDRPFTFDFYAPGGGPLMEVFRWPGGGSAARSVATEGGSVVASRARGKGWWTATAVGTSVFAVVPRADAFLANVFPNVRYAPPRGSAPAPCGPSLGIARGRAVARLWGGGVG